MVTLSIAARLQGSGSLECKKVVVIDGTSVTNWEELANALRTRFENHISDVREVEVLYDNAPSIAKGDRWCRLKVHILDTYQTHVTNIFRTTGNLVIEHYSQLEVGDQEALEFLDWIKGPFRSLTEPQNVRFLTPWIAARGRKEAYNVHSIICPFVSEV